MMDEESDGIDSKDRADGAAAVAEAEAEVRPTCPEEVRTGTKDEELDGIDLKDRVDGAATEEEAEVRPACLGEVRTFEHARLSWNWPLWRTAASTQCPTGTSQPSCLPCRVFYTNMVLKTPD